ncbi:NAD(P)H-hydrate dehydratase [Candidatus Micrarchaeota archaeon]|nr:NAD(P)H-hydrate dehydratase [Candidatus Micrarchaeota archaeon]
MRKIAEMLDRKPWSHKYDFGHLLVIGGSRRYSGSPAFNALAALRSGVDLVTVAAPERAAGIVAGFAPDIITYPLNGECLSPKHIFDIKKLLGEKVTAVVIGGGLERRGETLQTVKKIHEATEVPFVFDADAIHAIREKGIKPRKHDVVTPHAREFRTVVGREVPDDEEKRKEITEDAALLLGCTILLKGHIDVISDGKRTESVKKAPESVYLTKGGTGDTLAGICGALLAQGYDSFDCAFYAARINGLAGSMAAKEKLCGVLASDLVGKIPDAVKKICAK